MSMLRPSLPEDPSFASWLSQLLLSYVVPVSSSGFIEYIVGEHIPGAESSFWLRV
jgi:hypothetical protein